jgi:hypothetical protein
MSEFHQRLATLFKKNRVSIAIFSKENNINRASLSAYINGHTMPGLPFFTSLFRSKSFKKIDAYWLFTGEAAGEAALNNSPSYLVNDTEEKYTSNTQGMSNQVDVLEELISRLLKEALKPILSRLDDLEARISALEKKN